MAFAAVVAYGPNNITVPILFHESAMDAHQYMADLGLVASDDGLSYETWVDPTTADEISLATALKNPSGEANSVARNALREALLKSYDSDNGELHLLKVTTIHPARPIVGWDFA